MADNPKITPLKPLEWIASSRNDLVRFPMPVRKAMGYALYLAQAGLRAPAAKPLKGFGGAGVLEIVQDHDGNAFRAVYTVRFAKALAFQKKSKRGITMPRADVELIRQRYQAAAERYQQQYGKSKP